MDINIRKVMLHMLNDSDMQRIHDFSMRLLSEEGVDMPSERVLDIFRRYGFRIQGTRVYMREEQVWAALKTAPSHFVIRGRGRKLDLGGGDYGVPGPIGPVNVQDLDHGKRPGTLEDVENLVKIYQASDVMNMNSNNGVEANDIPVENRHLLTTRAVLRHSDKPFYTKVFNYRQMNEVMDLIEIAVGEKLRAGGNIYLSAGSTPSISPLRWSRDVLENILALAERGQVVTTGTATSAGITGPMSIFGTLILQNAEVLSGIVLAQLIHPGNPVGYGTAATPANMYRASSSFGSPGRVALSVGFTEMGKQFYHLPTRTLTYSTDSVSMDLQAAVESYENTMANALGNADYALSEIGTLDGLMTTSYEKTIIDEEITSRLIYMHKGIGVSDEDACMEVIRECAGVGQFMMADDTIEKMGDNWYPKYTDWNTRPPKREIDDYTYVLRRANAEWKKRLEEAPQSLLDKEREEELEKYIEGHLR